jgi:hypothetical protein
MALNLTASGLAAGARQNNNATGAYPDLPMTGSAQDLSAVLNRAQFNDYVQRFVPKENEALQTIGLPVGNLRTVTKAYVREQHGLAPDARLTPDLRREVRQSVREQRQTGVPLLQKLRNDRLMGEATANAEQGFQMANGAEDRDLAGYGMALTPEQQQAMTQSRGLAQGLAQVDAMNQTRDQLRDMDTATLADMVGIGRSGLSEAGSGLNTAAQLQGQRDVTNRQIAASDKATNIGAGAAAAGIAVSIAVAAIA